MIASIQRERLHSLQALRAFAAITVLLFHVCNDSALGFRPDPGLMRALQVGADCAVDLFFVLSGFIMVYTQAFAQRGAADFAGQRLRRIVPLYWATTFAFALFVLVAEPAAPGLGGALVQLQAAKNFLGSSLLFVSHWLGYPFPVVLPGWSLEYEMLFYALFAGAILASRRHTVAIVCALLAGLAFTGLLRPICLEFAAGALVALAWFRGWHRQLAALGLLVAPAVIVAGLLSGRYGEVDGNDWVRLLFCGVPMLALFLLALCGAQRRRPALAMLGDCSYAIYVSHCLWLAVFVHWLLPLFAPGSPAALAAGLAWCLGGGMATHFLVEKRFDRLLQGAPAARMVAVSRRIVRRAAATSP